MQNMAEIILARAAENGSKGRLGRTPAIDDGRLWNERDRLVWLFEVTWRELGGFSRIRTPADVYEVLKVWEQPENQNRHNTSYVAQTLLRSSAVPATANLLNERRRRLGELHEAHLAALKVRDQCRGAVETAQRALAPNLTASDRASVEEQIAKRTEKLNKAEAELTTAEGRELSLGAGGDILCAQRSRSVL